MNIILVSYSYISTSSSLLVSGRLKLKTDTTNFNDFHKSILANVSNKTMKIGLKRITERTAQSSKPPNYFNYNLHLIILNTNSEMELNYLNWTVIGRRTVTVSTLDGHIGIPFSNSNDAMFVLHLTVIISNKLIIIRTSILVINLYVFYLFCWLLLVNLIFIFSLKTWKERRWLIRKFLLKVI